MCQMPMLATDRVQAGVRVRVGGRGGGRGRGRGRGEGRGGGRGSGSVGGSGRVGGRLSAIDCNRDWANGHSVGSARTSSLSPRSTN